MDKNHDTGADVVIRPADHVPERDDILFVIHPDGRLAPPDEPVDADDTLVVLEGGRP